MLIVPKNGCPASEKCITKYIQADDYFKVAMIATKGDRDLSMLISEAVSKSELIKVERTQRT